MRPVFCVIYYDVDEFGWEGGLQGGEEGFDSQDIDDGGLAAPGLRSAFGW